MKQSSNGMRKVLAVLLVGFFVISLTAVAASAQGYYAGNNYHIYYAGQSGYIVTTDTPIYWNGNVPVFLDSPNSINTGDIEIVETVR